MPLPVEIARQLTEADLESLRAEMGEANFE